MWPRWPISRPEKSTPVLAVVLGSRASATSAGPSAASGIDAPRGSPRRRSRRRRTGRRCRRARPRRVCPMRIASTSAAMSSQSDVERGVGAVALLGGPLDDAGQAALRVGRGSPSAGTRRSRRRAGRARGRRTSAPRPRARADRVVGEVAAVRRAPSDRARGRGPAARPRAAPGRGAGAAPRRSRAPRPGARRTRLRRGTPVRAARAAAASRLERGGVEFEVSGRLAGLVPAGRAAASASRPRAARRRRRGGRRRRAARPLADGPARRAGRTRPPSASGGSRSPAFRPRWPPSRDPSDARACSQARRVHRAIPTCRVAAPTRRASSSGPAEGVAWRGGALCRSRARKPRRFAPNRDARSPARRGGRPPGCPSAPCARQGRASSRHARSAPGRRPAGLTFNRPPPSGS